MTLAMHTTPAVAANSAFVETLRRSGATFDADQVTHFGEPDAERAAVLAGATLHALTGEGLIEVTGADAQVFLQGQLSNDVSELNEARAQLSTYCTPQGRMLATLLAWRSRDRFVLQLPLELAAPVRARLQKYVLRADARLADISARHAVLGLGGRSAGRVLEQAFGAAPSAAMAKLEFDWGSVLCLRADLYQLVVAADAAAQTWDQLASAARPVGTQWWRWRLIQAGIPMLSAPTQDRFVPQMANMDALGAISFSKGCYPGQEIVARAEYRGQVKRRLFRLHAEAGAPDAGMELFAPPHPGSVGLVVNAASAPDGGFDVLAVVQIESAERGGLRLGAPEGPALAPAGPS